MVTHDRGRSAAARRLGTWFSPTRRSPPTGRPSTTVRRRSGHPCSAGVHKSYGAVRAVDGLDLTIAPGEIVAVLGPNGAGKSTTTEMITGLTDPDAARSRCSDVDPRPLCAQGRVGAMLQAGALLQEATVRDVLRLMHGLHAHPLPLAEVIERADLGGVPQDQDREAVRRPGAAAALRAGDHGRSAAVDLGRADGRHGRGDPTRASGRRCGTSSPTAGRCCSPPTTWTRPTPRPTGSWCSPAAGWSPTAPRP